MKRKSKSLSSDIKKTILDKAHLYMKPIIKESSSESEEDPQPKRKATEADKERKREKRKLKKKLKREAKEKSKKKDDSEAKKLAINYLHMWHHARDMWSFKKKQQYWLLTNAFDVDCISNENFQVFLEYLYDLKGEAKNRLNAECEKIIQMHEEKFSSNASINDEDTLKFERARSIIQVLI